MFRVWCKEKIARFLFVNSVIWAKKKTSQGEKDDFQSSTVKFLLGVAIPFSMGVERREGTGIPSIPPAPINPYHMACEILGA